MAGEESGFKVELAQSGAIVDVPPGVSILQAIRAAGFDWFSACEQGNCGACEVPVLDGVPEHRDQFLSESDKLSGQTIMICVSRAKTELLKLDL